MCLKLIKLNDIYELKVEKCICNYVHRSLPHYLSDIFITFTHDIHILETRPTSHIRPLTSITVETSNSFLCKGPVIWNIIPITIQQKSTIKCFAVSVKAIVVNGYEELAESYSI